MLFLAWAARVMFMIAVSLSAGALGSLVTRPSSLEWYKFLSKPPLTPPSYVFGIVWLVLYFLMGTAAGIIWNIPVYLSRVRQSLIAYFIQLLLTIVWPVLFFGFHLVGWALLCILILWGCVILTVILFYTQSKMAGIMMFPYLAWVTFAVYLNAGFWILSP